MLNAAEWREQTLRRLQWDVKRLADCTEPGKPVYYDLDHIASDLPGYTGYYNSTDVESWSEERRIKRWRLMQARARRKLAEFEGRASRRRRRSGSKSIPLKKDSAKFHTDVERMIGVLQETDEPLTINDIHERVYGPLPASNVSRPSELPYVRRINALMQYARRHGINIYCTRGARTSGGGSVPGRYSLAQIGTELELIGLA